MSNESFDRTASHMAGEYVSNNEPVAWGMLDKDGGIYDSISPEEHDREEGAYTIPLYTHPAKELTDEKILKMAANMFHYSEYRLVIEFARAILRKAQEK
jgi:nitrate reductase gamma subunit